MADPIQRPVVRRWLPTPNLLPELTTEQNTLHDYTLHLEQRIEGLERRLLHVEAGERAEKRRRERLERQLAVAIGAACEHALYETCDRCMGKPFVRTRDDLSRLYLAACRRQAVLEEERDTALREKAEAVAEATRLLRYTEEEHLARDAAEQRASEAEARRSETVAMCEQLRAERNANAALIEEYKEHAKLQAQLIVKGAQQVVEAEAKLAEAEAARDDLRQFAIVRDAGWTAQAGPPITGHCRACGSLFRRGQAEQHAPECMAIPSSASGALDRALARIDTLEGESRAATDTAAMLRAHIETLREALRQVLRIGERHTDTATGRRLADFHEAIAVARAALATTPTSGLMEKVRALCVVAEKVDHSGDCDSPDSYEEMREALTALYAALPSLKPEGS